MTVVNDFLADKAAEVAGAVGARAEADPIAAINDPDVDAVLLRQPGRGARGTAQRVPRPGHPGAV